MDIITTLNNKKILIWGYGREGKSTERFIQAHCPSAKTEVYEGPVEGVKFDDYDLVIKSPGIFTTVKNEKMTSQTELFLSQFSSQTIGITGTKGKSTTSSLMYSTLSSLPDRKVLLVGNIGYPCLDYYDDIDENTIVVYELSCHQLYNCRYSPHVAVFLNLFEDHLDYYGTKEVYFNAKANITRHQVSGDHFYCGSNVPALETEATTHKLPDVDQHLYEIDLLGEHNQYNANVVYTVCSELYGMSDKDIRDAFSKFHGLPHRMEFVGNVDGIDYYDDSISTIPEAAIQAIQSIKNTKSIIIGGMDRNIDYSLLIDFIRSHTNILYILAYSSGERIYKEVSDLPCCVHVADLKAAVRTARALTPVGGACVLSPAAASYGYFKNFEERGDYYKQYVLAATKKETSLVFTGDIGFDKYMSGRWTSEDLLSDKVKDFISSADHAVVNVEGPLMEAAPVSGNSGVTQLLHYMDKDVARWLNDIGADIWSLCNNHIMDAGPEGLESTLNIAKYYGAPTIGVGMNVTDARKPVILTEAGGIGMICVGYQRACRAAEDNKPGCFRWDDLDAIGNAIHDIKSKCRWCIVVAHAGEEFTPLPSPYTREKFMKYLELGADIVVCHHPHVPMNYETVGDKTIFYSLGNFIFDTDYQRSQHYTDSGILLNLKFTEENYSFEAMGIKIVRGEERIVEAPLPDIFEDVGEDEYQKLLPLSVKAFIEATKRQLAFLYPAEYTNPTEEKLMENFMQPLRSGRVPGEVLDMQILCPIAEKAEENAWKESKHKKIIDFILNQMKPVENESDK